MKINDIFDNVTEETTKAYIDIINMASDYSLLTEEFASTLKELFDDDAERINVFKFVNDHIGVHYDPNNHKDIVDVFVDTLDSLCDDNCHDLQEVLFGLSGNVDGLSDNIFTTDIVNRYQFLKEVEDIFESLEKINKIITNARE